MDFTLIFIQLFLFGIWLTAPILLLLVLIIVLLGQWVGRRESWSRFEAFYWSFVTATTVGYGDIRPLARGSRIMSVLIAIFGVIFTGIIVAVAVNATTRAIQTQHYPDSVERMLHEHKE